MCCFFWQKIWFFLFASKAKLLLLLWESALNDCCQVNTLNFFGIMQLPLCIWFCYGEEKFYSQAHHTHILKNIFHSGVRYVMHVFARKNDSFLYHFFQSFYTKRIIFVTRNSYINYEMNAYNSLSSTTSNCVSISALPPLHCLTLLLERKKCNSFQSIHFALTLCAVIKFSQLLMKSTSRRDATGHSSISCVWRWVHIDYRA